MTKKSPKRIALAAALAIAAMLSYLPGTEAGRIKPNTAQMLGFYEALFEDVDTSLYMETRHPVLIGTTKLGMYMCGINGILEYHEFDTAVNTLHGTATHSEGPYAKVSKLAGIQIVLTEPTHDNEFRHFNPAIIKWGLRALLPKPKHIGPAGVRYKTLYKRSFSRFFRLLAAAYRLLNQDKKWAKREMFAYKQAARQAGQSFDGLEWLKTRYQGVLKQFAVPAKHEDEGGYTAMTPPQAIGFWLRRKNDNTDTLLWRGLKKVLRVYDKGWKPTKAMLKRPRRASSSKSPKARGLTNWVGRYKRSDETVTISSNGVTMCEVMWYDDTKVPCCSKASLRLRSGVLTGKLKKKSFSEGCFSQGMLIGMKPRKNMGRILIEMVGGEGDRATEIEVKSRHLKGRYRLIRSRF